MNLFRVLVTLIVVCPSTGRSDEAAFGFGTGLPVWTEQAIPPHLLTAFKSPDDLLSARIHRSFFQKQMTPMLLQRLRSPIGDTVYRFRWIVEVLLRAFSKTPMFGFEKGAEWVNHLMPGEDGIYLHMHTDGISGVGWFFRIDLNRLESGQLLLSHPLYSDASLLDEMPLFGNPLNNRAIALGESALIARRAARDARARIVDIQQGVARILNGQIRPLYILRSYVTPHGEPTRFFQTEHNKGDNPDFSQVYKKVSTSA